MYDRRSRTPLAVFAGQLQEVYTFTANVKGQEANHKRKKCEGFDLFQFGVFNIVDSQKKSFTTVEGNKYVLEPVGPGREEVQVTRNGKVCMYANKQFNVGGFLAGYD